MFMPNPVSYSQYRNCCWIYSACKNATTRVDFHVTSRKRECCASLHYRYRKNRCHTEYIAQTVQRWWSFRGQPNDVYPAENDGNNTACFRMNSGDGVLEPTHLYSTKRRCNVYTTYTARNFRTPSLSRCLCIAYVEMSIRSATNAAYLT